MYQVAELRRAVVIAEKIDDLQAKLRELLGLDSTAPVPRTKLSRTGRKIAAHRKSTNDLGSGLAPAVHKVLTSAKKPLRVGEILSRLLDSGYKFVSKNPGNVLGARIYKLKGVKKVGEGLFAPA